MDTDKYDLKRTDTNETFATGSKRGSAAGKGMPASIPTLFTRRLAAVIEKGAAVYGMDNWRKGQPLRRMMDSLLRHAMSATDGQEDEDHLAQVAWNAMAIMVILEDVRAGRLPRDLVDLPYNMGPEKGDPTIIPTFRVVPVTAKSGGSLPEYRQGPGRRNFVICNGTPACVVDARRSESKFHDVNDCPFRRQPDDFSEDTSLDAPKNT